MSQSRHRRIRREQRTIAAMLAVYCRAHHADASGELCPDCNKLLTYAGGRLDACPFQEAKPACNLCQVHCYSPAMRERVSAVMRYAGPRMVLRHPILSLFHLFDTWRPIPALRKRRR